MVEVRGSEDSAHIGAIGLALVPLQWEGLVFKAHRLVYHSTLGLRVIKKKRGTNVMLGRKSEASPT